MMKIRHRQPGFSTVELAIVLLLVATLSFVGYTVYKRQQTKNSDISSYQSQQSSQQSTKAGDVSSAPEIKEASDLNEAIKVLDQNDPSTSYSDASQLDSELANF